jgi:thiol-disulfide isomerase/thioredoxin
MPMPRVAIIAVAALVLAAGCSDGQVRRSGDGGQTRYIEGTGAITTVPVGDREPAPDFGGPLLDGGEFDLAEARGDVVVLNVWGSWCPPCRKEAPDLQAVAESLAADGVRFVGINTRDNPTDARAFQAEFGVTYPSVVDTDGARMLAFRDTLPPAAIPTTLVIDRQGRVAARVLGAITETSLRDLIGDVIAEDAGAAP